MQSPLRPWAVVAGRSGASETAEFVPVTSPPLLFKPSWFLGRRHVALMSQEVTRQGSSVTNTDNFPRGDKTENAALTHEALTFSVGSSVGFRIQTSGRMTKGLSTPLKSSACNDRRSLNRCSFPPAALRTPPTRLSLVSI